MADKQVRNLKISFLVWRELVSRLRDPADTLEGVIRRLLALPEEDGPPARTRHEAPEPKRRGRAGDGQRGAGMALTMRPELAVELTAVPVRGLAGVPDGTRIRGTYKGKTYTGRIADGVVIIDQIKGRTFGSLSAAAEHNSQGHQNGWQFWEAQAPGMREWVRADAFRRGGRKRAPEQP